MVGAGPGAGSYVLALAGASLPDTSAAIVTLTRTVEIRELLEHVGRLDEEIRKLVELRAELDDTRRDRQQAIELLAGREQEAARLPVLEERVRAAETQLHVQHSELTGQIHELGTSVNELGKSMDELGAELERTRSLLNDVMGSLSWRVTAPLRAIKRLLRSR